MAPIVFILSGLVLSYALFPASPMAYFQ